MRIVVFHRWEFSFDSYIHVVALCILKHYFYEWFHNNLRPQGLRAFLPFFLADDLENGRFAKSKNFWFSLKITLKLMEFIGIWSQIWPGKIPRPSK